PLMLHRTIYGSIERFFASLIEFYAGKFPLWLSPTQVRVVAVATRHGDYARQVEALFAKQGFDVDVDDSNESVSKKIRDAQMQQYNYILTVGDQEVANHTVSLRTRDNVVHGEVNIAKFMETISRELAEKALASPYSNSKPEKME